MFWPLRETSLTAPPTRITPARTPSSLRSNSHAGSENGPDTSTAFIGA